jgi:hypothetical protein
MLCAPYRRAVSVIGRRIAAGPDREYAATAVAAYAVIARIGRVDPHLTVRDLDRDLDDDERTGRGRTVAASTEEVELRSEVGPIAERVLRWRELWTQTTFYLFDAESWRT